MSRAPLAAIRPPGSRPTNAIPERTWLKRASGKRNKAQLAAAWTCAGNTPAPAASATTRRKVATWARVVLDVSAIDYGGAIQFEDLELRLLSGPVTHLVTLGAGAHGAISPSGAVWVANGANLEIAVTADAYYHIDEISLPPLVLFPTNPVHVTFLLSAVTNSQSVSATFAEDVTSDVPHWWLAQYHAGTNFTAMVVEDLDGDGFSGAEEYVALTDPSASNEYLRLDTSVAALTPARLRR